jgi:hypothetical protein
VLSTQKKKLVNIPCGLNPTKPFQHFIIASHTQHPAKSL